MTFLTMYFSLALAMLAWTCLPSAATLTYHYVGQPATISTGPLVNTGRLTVDEGLVSEDGRLEMTDGVRNFGSGEFSYHFLMGEGTENTLPGFSVSFADREIVDWDFGTEAGFGGDDRQWFRVSRPFGDRYHTSPGQGNGDIAQIRAEGTLKALGYRSGTDRYQELFCGSWAPGYTGQCNNDVWEVDFLAPPTGLWTTDETLFKEILAQQLQRARENPPANFKEIAPIPAPPAFLLVLSGIATIGLAGYRRRRR